MSPGGQFPLPDGREVKSHGEVVIGTLLHTAGVPFIYEASFPFPAGEAGGAAGAGALPEDLRDYRPDFYLPDDPKAPVTAEGGIWLEHYAHDRSGRAPAEFAGYEEARAWKRRLHENLSTRYVETTFGDLQRAWDGDGPGMAEVLVERLRAVGVKIDDPKCWTVEAADDVGDGPADGPGPLTLEVDAWIGAVRRRPAGRPPPTGRADVGALRRIIGRAVRRRYERELADTRTTDHDGTILEATDAARRRPDLLPWHHVIVDEYQDVNPSQAAFVHALTTPKGPGPRGEGATLIGVGDAWQAIFGFQGGDASLIRTTADPAGVVQTLSGGLPVAEPAIRSVQERVVSPGGGEDPDRAGPHPGTVPSPVRDLALPPRQMRLQSRPALEAVSCDGVPLDVAYAALVLPLRPGPVWRASARSEPPIGGERLEPVVELDLARGRVVMDHQRPRVVDQHLLRHADPSAGSLRWRRVRGVPARFRPDPKGTCPGER